MCDGDRHRVIQAVARSGCQLPAEVRKGSARQPVWVGNSVHQTSTAANTSTTLTPHSRLGQRRPALQSANTPQAGPQPTWLDGNCYGRIEGKLMGSLDVTRQGRLGGCRNLVARFCYGGDEGLLLVSGMEDGAISTTLGRPSHAVVETVEGQSSMILPRNQFDPKGWAPSSLFARRSPGRPLVVEVRCACT